MCTSVPCLTAGFGGSSQRIASVKAKSLCVVFQVNDCENVHSEKFIDTVLYNIDSQGILLCGRWFLLLPLSYLQQAKFILNYNPVLIVMTYLCSMNFW